MKPEERDLRELVEPDQDAGSSASVQRREPWGTGADSGDYRDFGDLLAISRSNKHHTRKGRHMQWTQIPAEAREGMPVRYRPRPGKNTRRDKKKEKGRSPVRRREYYEYGDRFDEEKYTGEMAGDEVPQRNGRTVHDRSTPGMHP